MSGHRSTHAYEAWAEERVAEMNAAIESLSAAARNLEAEAKAKGDHLIIELKEGRERFRSAVAAQAEAGRAAWKSIAPELESQWDTFEDLVKTYFEKNGKQKGKEHAAFREIAAAQTKAWKTVAKNLEKEAAKLAAGKRSDIDGAIAHLKAKASEAEAHLKKLEHAGQESWSAFGAALAESRKAFDKANQKAWRAFRRAAD